MLLAARRPSSRIGNCVRLLRATVNGGKHLLEKSFKKSPTTACLAIALAALVVPLSAPASADVSVSAPKTFGIVVDGQVGDWANVPRANPPQILPPPPP